MADVAHIAGKAGGKVGDYAPLLIALALVGAAVYVYSNSSGSSGYQIVGASNNSAERAAVDAQTASLASAHETAVQADFSALVGEATSAYNSDTQIALGDQTLRSQLAGYQAQSQIASLAEQASVAQSNAALSAAQAQAHASQQNGLWNSIASIFSSSVGAFTGGLFGGGGGGGSSSSGYNYGYSGLGANVLGGNSAPLG